MWRQMALAVPGFDPAQHVSAPVWDDYRNILTSVMHMFYIVASRQNGGYIMMNALAAQLFYGQFNNRSTLKSSLLFKHTLNCTKTWIWGTSHLLFV
jgi:hypothetical protein